MFTCPFPQLHTFCQISELLLSVRSSAHVCFVHLKIFFLFFLLFWRLSFFDFGKVRQLGSQVFFVKNVDFFFEKAFCGASEGHLREKPSFFICRFNFRSVSVFFSFVSVLFKFFYPFLGVVAWRWSWVSSATDRHLPTEERERTQLHQRTKGRQHHAKGDEKCNNTHRRRRKPISTTQQKRGGKAVPPKGGEGRQHHAKRRRGTKQHHPTD